MLRAEALTPKDPFGCCGVDGGDNGGDGGACDGKWSDGADRFCFWRCAAVLLCRGALPSKRAGALTSVALSVPTAGSCRDMTPPKPPDMG